LHFSADKASSLLGISETEIAEKDPLLDDKVSSSDFYSVAFFVLFISVTERERDSSKLIDLGRTQLLVF
jgi:hypothetical protein